MEEDEYLDSEQCCTLFEELLIEILEWLPIKSLVRFSIVSKNWNRLIKTKIFITNHRRKQGSKGTMLLLRRRLPPPQFDGKDDVLSFHDLDGSLENEMRTSIPISFLEELVGRDSIPHQFSFVGSCDGIVCINYGFGYILCNPALHEFKILPPCSFWYPEGCRRTPTAHAFGVDFCQDFKVIVMHRVPEHDKTSILPSNFIHLYSSKTNSWRRIDDRNVPGYPFVHRIENVVFFKGAFHWFGCSYGKTTLSFDINTEVFREIELEFPEVLCRSDIGYPVPVFMDGCLGAVWFSETVPVEAWVMKEYGVKESWTKKFQMSPQPLASHRLLWKNDMVLMVHEPILGLPMEERVLHLYVLDKLDEKFNGQLVSLSLQTNDIKRFQVYGATNTMRMLIYEETLVSLFH